MLLCLFAFSGAYRLHYRAPEESRQRGIAWHRGPDAYLNESRILMTILSIVLICAAGDIGSLACDQLTLAALWLSLRGVVARRRIADRDQRMTPIALSPRDFVVTSIVVATITVGLVEAVAWSSFAGWLL